MIVGGILTLCDLAGLVHRTDTIIATYGMPLLVVQTWYVRSHIQCRRSRAR